MEQLNFINAALIKHYRKKLEYHSQDFKNRLELGWCYLQNDSLHQALALLANQIPDEANAEEYHNLWESFIIPMNSMKRPWFI